MNLENQKLSTCFTNQFLVSKTYKHDIFESTPEVTNSKYISTEGSFTGRKISNKIEISSEKQKHNIPVIITKKRKINCSPIQEKFEKTNENLKDFNSKSLRSKSKNLAKSNIKTNKSQKINMQTIKNKKKNLKKKKKMNKKKTIDNILSFKKNDILKHNNQPIIIDHPLIQKSLLNYKLEKQKKIEEKKRILDDKIAKNLELNLKNEEIRKKNAERFIKVKKEKNDYAWGADQKKIKTLYLSKLLIENKENFQPERKNYKKDDVERRKILGLDFLQRFNPKKIQNIIQKSKPKIQSNQTSIKNKITISPEKKYTIRNFIEVKRKKIEEASLQKIIEEYLKGSKIQENLKKLQSDVKQIFAETPYKQQTRTSNKKQSKSSLERSPPENEESYDHEYSLLEIECKKIIEDWSKPNILKENNHKSKSKMQIKNEINKKKLSIKDQFILVSKKFHALTANTNLTQKSDLKENNNLINILPEEEEEVEKSIISERKITDRTLTISRNDILLLQEKMISSPDFKNEESIKSEKENIRNKSEPNIINDLIIESKIEENIIKKPIKKHQLSDEKAGEEPTSQRVSEISNHTGSDLDSDIIRENLQILENIAVMIQKVWRGYRTRKILSEYFQLFLEGGKQNETNNNSGVIMEDDREYQIESLHKSEGHKNKKNKSDGVFDRIDFFNNQENNFYNKKEEEKNKKQDIYENKEKYESDHINQDIIVDGLQSLNQSPHKLENSFENQNLMSSLDQLALRFNQQMEFLEKDIDKKNKNIKINENKEKPQINILCETPKNFKELNILPEMRLVLCSEKILREQSQSWSSPCLKNIRAIKQQESLPSSPSLFEQAPFQDFTQKKYNELLNSDNMKSFIDMREKIFEKSKSETTSARYEGQSPNTLRGSEPEKWIQKDKQQKKSVFSKIKGELAIKRTKRDMILRLKMQNHNLERSYYSDVKNKISENNDSILSKSWQSLNALGKYHFENKHGKNHIKNDEQWPNLSYEDEHNEKKLRNEIFEKDKLDKKHFNSDNHEKKNEYLTEISPILAHNFDLEKDDLKSAEIEINELLATDERKNIVSSIIFDELLEEMAFEMTSSKCYTKLNGKSDEILPINTSVYAVEEFINLVVEMLLGDNHQKLIAELLYNINQSYDDNIINKLQILRCGVFNSLFNEYIIRPPNVLSPTIFNLVDSEIFNNFNSETKISKNCQKIIQTHNQSIYDCLNEALDYFRPFDVRGKPNPWKCNPKKISYTDIDEKNIEIVLDQAKNKVMEWSCFQCGIHLENLEENLFSIEEFEKLKNEKIERLIMNDVYEKEEKWINYEDYENVVKIEISQLIFDELISELIGKFQEKF